MTEATTQEHDCLRDAPKGEKHCITCHQQGHHYDAHWPFGGLVSIDFPEG